MLISKADNAALAAANTDNLKSTGVSTKIIWVEYQVVDVGPGHLDCRDDENNDNKWTDNNMCYQEIEDKTKQCNQKET